MPDSPRNDLPESIEDEVLAILDGDDTARDPALARLLDSHPQHARTIRAWLTEAGVTVPGAAGVAVGKPPALGHEVLPVRLGAYVLQELLGRGGFGTVYRAEQQEPIRRPVAVKVLNPGMDSREVLARFAAEREALNRMDHPGIARLLDAGQTEHGRPYFVMELVLGPTLANLCRVENLPLHTRLELFLQVLDAMQHAHQKAVLHRDLSSNNVLVADPTARAQCKIIDFGIAKSLADPLLQGGAMTFQGTLMGTPEFMSPEQAAGSPGDVDTRADVYALGVQLYELLTDQLPIPGVVLRAQGIAGMVEAIAAHQPLLPSHAAPQQRRAALHGDLDAITMKAISKARDERYATVAEFAADLRAHLADQPVLVASPTTWYRLRKFVRRNRAQSVAAAIVACGLLAALGVLLWALGIANAALTQAEEQKAELKAKADAGFRLLANEERLREAISAESSLPPPWPEHAETYSLWLAELGAPLAAEQDKLREKLGQLANNRTAPGGRFPDPVDQHLFTALQRLAAELSTFADDDGPLARVRRKLQFLDEVVAASMREHAALWQQTIASIKNGGSNGGRDYRGAQLAPLPGLVPLGRHPRTGLFEFLDLCSHARGLGLPAREAGTGDLQLQASTGIVFVLLPVGVFRIGAFRGEPGLPQNDPAASDDELAGQLVNLDEFLISKTELTVGQWAALGGTRVASGDDAMLPMTGIDWHEGKSLLRQFDLDLPTEAQWEYACRAGTTTPWSCGSDVGRLPEHAWLGARPQRVALLASNGFGLFDLHGNAAEWCRDEKLPYRDFVPLPGEGLRRSVNLLSSPRVIRGGACYQGANAGRAAAREGRAPSQRDSATGLRPIRLLRQR